MADERELFPTLEKSDESGTAPSEGSIGLASAGKVYTPVLAAVDLSADLALIPIRVAGEAPGNALPSLTCLDESGNLAYLSCMDDGSLIVTLEGVGDDKSTSATVEPATIGVELDVAVVTLAISKEVHDIQFSASNFHATLWKVIQTDDVTDTEVARFLTGPGAFSFSPNLEKVLSITTGGSGTQELKLTGTQVAGKLSSMHGVIGAIEAP